jgi:uroporphyrinogen-III decarboxylase
MWSPLSNARFLESSHPVEISRESSRQGNTSVFHSTIHTPKGDLTETSTCTDGVHTFWQTEHLCKSIDDVEKALSVPYEPVEWNAGDYQRIKTEVGDNGIIMGDAETPLLQAARLMSFEDYLVWAKTETEHFARTVAAMHERNMENLRRMLEVNVLDLYRICGPEYVTPPYLPPEFFGRLELPYLKEMVELFHGKGAKVRIHCHGKIARILDMIRETGAEGLDPCEGPPDGDITLAEVKRRVGKDMCIFGNIQVKLLEQGSEDEVETTVKECMNAAKEGGGYVIMPTASPFSTPLPEKTARNYIRFIETALQYGRY